MTATKSAFNVMFYSDFVNFLLTIDLLINIREMIDESYKFDEILFS